MVILVRFSPETRPVAWISSFCPIPQWTVAELRKVKAYVLMLTQLLGTGQRIGFFSLYIWKYHCYSCIFGNCTYCISGKNPKIIKKLIPIIAVVLVHKYENIYSIFYLIMAEYVILLLLKLITLKVAT